MLLGRAVHLKEEVSDMAGIVEGETRIGSDPNCSAGVTGNAGPEPGVLTLVPADELDARCLAECQFEDAAKIRNHEVVFEEPLGPARVLFFPPNRLGWASVGGKNLGGVPGEDPGSSELEAVGDEGCAGIEVGSHPLTRGVAAHVPVVKQALEPAGDLLVGTGDQRTDMAGLEVPIPVDEVEDREITWRQGEVAVSGSEAVGLRNESPEPG